MMKKFLLIIVLFCVLSLTTGAPKEDKETKEDEDRKDEEDTKPDTDDDTKDDGNKVDESVDKEKDVKDGKGDDEKDGESKDDEEKKDESKDGESKDEESKDDDENKDKSKDGESKDNESKDDEIKDGESKNEEETKDDKNKDESSKYHSKMDIITRFSLELFRKVAEEKRHHSFSLSALPIWKQMSCLLAGTEGDTKKQLSKMLYHGEGEEDLKTELFSPKLNDVLKVYSRIYITEDAKLKAEFSPKKRHRRSIDDEEQGDESSEVSNEKIEEEEEEELNSNEKIEEEANEKIEEEDLNSNEKIEEDKLNSMEDAVKADSKEDKSKENKKDDKPEEDEKHKDGGGVDDLNSKCDYSKLFKKVDFSNLKAVNKTINRDFDKASHGKFKRVLGKGVIDKKTKMLMINAVEFKGKLLESFDEKRTVKKNFYSYKNEKVGTVNMMIKKSTFPYYHCTKLGASILELPYVNKMSLFVYLPDVTNIDAKNLLNKFKDPTKVMKILDKMNDTKVEVHLPKFKATANIHAHLKKALKHMGVADIFKTEDAKLQGFLEDDLEDFSLKTVSQAIRFTVNEKGSLEGAKVSGSSIKFVCNRPFAFMVIDKETGHPIITGEFNSPKDIHL